MHVRSLPLSLRLSAFGHALSLALGCSAPASYVDPDPNPGADHDETTHGVDSTETDEPPGTSSTTDLLPDPATLCPLEVGLPKVTSECATIGGDVHKWTNSIDSGHSENNDPWLSDQGLCFAGSAWIEEWGLSERTLYSAGLTIWLAQGAGVEEVPFDASAHGFDGVRFSLSDDPNLDQMTLEITATDPATGEFHHYRDDEQVLHAGVNEVRFAHLRLVGDDGELQDAPLDPRYLDVLQWSANPASVAGFSFEVCISDLVLISDRQ